MTTENTLPELSAAEIEEIADLWQEERNNFSPFRKKLIKFADSICWFFSHTTFMLLGYVFYPVLTYFVPLSGMIDIFLYALCFLFLDVLFYFVSSDLDKISQIDAIRLIASKQYQQKFKSGLLLWGILILYIAGFPLLHGYLKHNIGLETFDDVLMGQTIFTFSFIALVKIFNTRFLLNRVLFFTGKQRGTHQGLGYLTPGSIILLILYPQELTSLYDTPWMLDGISSYDIQKYYHYALVVMFFMMPMILCFRVGRIYYADEWLISNKDKFHFNKT